MLRSQAIVIIKRGLGFRQTQDSAIIAAINAAQRNLQQGQTLPNWLLAFDQELPVTAGVATLETPDRFLRLHEDYPMYYLRDGARIIVPRKTNAEARAAYPGPENLATGGYPQVFVQDNHDQFTLIPTPTISFTMYLTAYKGAEPLSSDIENEWLANAPNYLIGVAGVLVAGDLRDKGAMDKFSLMAKMGNRALIGEIVEDELAGRSLIMGRNN